MSTVLITGASGFIGQALAAAMSVDHDVLCMSRHDPDLSLPWIRGEFGSFEDLRQLDDQRIDVVVHLGAVTGGCLEHDGMLVNVDGTRCLMRYLIDRGCRKFVMASSIAAVGFQSTQFRPLQVPIPDEHPCFDRDGYGFSKYLMEEVTRYYSRQNDEIDVIDDARFHLLSVMDALGLGSVPVVGHCIGGWLAAELAVHHRERIERLCLIGASGLKVAGEPIADLFWQLQPLNGTDWSGLRRLLFAESESSLAHKFYPEGRNEIEIELLRFKMCRFASRIGFRPPYFQDPKLAGRLDRCDRPALVLWGRNNLLVPLAHGEAYTNGLGDARFEVLDQSGHCLHIEQPEKVAEIVKGFLTD